MVLDHHSTGGQRDRILYHYLKGLLFCYRCKQAGRVSRMIYTEANGRGGVRYGYFKCRSKQDGLCDLPHLPVDVVEWHVADRYAVLGLPARFRKTVREAIEAAMTDEQSNTRDAHHAYRKQLDKLSREEDRLLDLAVDGLVPRDKIRARLSQIQVQRTKAEAGLSLTSEKLAVGARLLQQYLDLMEDPAGLYGEATDSIRRDLNEASFERLWLDEDGVQDDEKTPAVQELHDAARTFAGHPGAVSGRADTLTSLSATKRTQAAANGTRETQEVLLADALGAGSNRTSLVPPTGFEPALPP